MLRILSKEETKARSANEAKFSELCYKFKSIVGSIIFCYIDGHKKEAEFRNKQAADMLHEILSVLDTIPDRKEYIDIICNTKFYHVDTVHPGNMNERLFAQTIPSNGVFILDGETVGDYTNSILAEETKKILQPIIDKYINKRQIAMAQAKMQSQKTAVAANVSTKVK